MRQPSNRRRVAGHAPPLRPPGRRQQAQPCPPPPEPEAGRSRPDQSPLAKLEVDLASEAVAERQVDEGEGGDEQCDRQPQTDRNTRIDEIAKKTPPSPCAKL